jgi:hypothetical protein
MLFQRDGSLCTGLSTASNVLTDAYFNIVQRWRDVRLQTYSLERFLRDSHIVCTSTIESSERIFSHFSFGRIGDEILRARGHLLIRDEFKDCCFLILKY